MLDLNKKSVRILSTLLVVCTVLGIVWSMPASMLADENSRIRDGVYYGFSYWAPNWNSGYFTLSNVVSREIVYNSNPASGRVLVFAETPATMTFLPDPESGHLHYTEGIHVRALHLVPNVTINDAITVLRAVRHMDDRSYWDDIFFDSERIPLASGEILDDSAALGGRSFSAGSTFILNEGIYISTWFGAMTYIFIIGSGSPTTAQTPAPTQPPPTQPSLVTQATSFIPSALNTSTVQTSGGNRTVTWVEVDLNAGYEISAVTARNSLNRSAATLSELAASVDTDTNSETILFAVNFHVTATQEIVGGIVSRGHTISGPPQPYLNHGIGFTADNRMSLFRGRISGNHVYGYDWRDPRLDYITAFNTYPHLIRNGQRLHIQPTSYMTQSWMDGRVQRSFMGQRTDGTFIVGTVAGTSISELQEIAAHFNLHNATNIDGGASSGIWRNGEYVHQPGRTLPAAMVITSTGTAHPPATQSPPSVQTTGSTRTLRFAIGNTNFTDNGILQSLEAAPFIQNDRTMVPLRVIGEALGATNMSFNAGVITFNINGRAFTMTVDQPLPNNMGIPIIVEGRTFVPLAFIINEMGATARWDGTARAAYIYIG